MNEKISHRVADWLCSYTGRRYCLLTGRGATGIYLILRALKKIRKTKKNKIVIPDIISPSVPNSVLYAGYEPVFCDVSLSDFNIDPLALRRLVETDKEIDGIMAVHLYGYPAEMTKIMEIADEFDLFVIEDAAQAMGGSYKNKKLGSLGDASIFSFGHTKILDCGGGGAVLTDNRELAEKIKTEMKKLPERPNNLEYLDNLYRKTYYTLYPLVKKEKLLEPLFLPLPSIFKEMYLYNISASEAHRIANELDKLEDYVAARRKNAKSYRKLLRHPLILHPKYKHWKWAPWRYSFLLKIDKQEEVTEMVRAKNIHISNWYPPVHGWYASGRKQDPRLFENSIYLGNHIINMWVDPSVSSEYIHRATSVLIDALDRVGE